MTKAHRRFVAVLAACGYFVHTAACQAATNSWTNTVATGFWQDATKWSLGVAPTNTQSGIFITNVTTKTVTINSATPAASLTISNLTVQGIGAGINRLQLTNMGAATPLRILDFFTVGTNAALLVTNSALQVDGLLTGNLNIDGIVSNRADGVIATTNAELYVGSSHPGQLFNHGGTILANNIVVSFVAAAPGTLTISGGSCTLSNILLLGANFNATGTVWITGGQLVVPRFSITVGSAGVGQMIVSNGTVLATNVLVSAGATSRGTLTVAGGTLAAQGPLRVGGTGATATGTVWVTGGQLVITNTPATVGAGSGFIIDGSVTLTNGSAIVVSNLATRVGNAGVGSLSVFGGSLLVSNVTVGNLAGSRGTLKVGGGTTTLNSFLFVGASLNATGAVLLTGGQLVVTNNSTSVGTSGVGEMTVSNGTWLARDADVGRVAGSQGTLTVAGGTNTVDVSLILGLAVNSTGTVWMTGGRLALNGPTTVGRIGVGQMTVSNGTWSALDVTVGANPGSAGTLTVAGGTNSVYTSLTLGNFPCTATGIVRVEGGRLFVTNAAATAVLEVRSGTLTLSSGTLTINSLVITNACGHFTKTGGTLSITTTNLTPSFDADGDGFSNQQESDAGTNPFDVLSTPPTPTVTSWTNSTGPWEVGANWSSGAPTSTLQQVLITNAATKTVTINSATPGGNLTISNLTLSAPIGFVNGLQLTNMTTATPLRVLNNFTISSFGALVITNSALQVDGTLRIDFGATTREGGLIVATNMIIGSAANSSGTLNVFGGTNRTSSSLNVASGTPSTGAVWVTSGLLTVTNQDVVLGFGGSSRAQMTISNGTVQANRIFVGLSAGSQGTLTVAGGTATFPLTLDLGDAANATGAVWLTGGRLAVTNGFTLIGVNGVGQMTVSNGTWLATNVFVGVATGSQGTLSIAGGTNAVVGPVRVGNSLGGAGHVIITGGRLIVTNDPVAVSGAGGASAGFIIDGSVTMTNNNSSIVATNASLSFQVGVNGSGSLTISGGSLLANGLVLGFAPGARGTLTIDGGSHLVDTTLMRVGDDGFGAVWLNGGQLVVTNADFGNNDLEFGNDPGGAGQMTVSNGTLIVGTTLLGNDMTTQGTLTIAGGTNIFTQTLIVGERADGTGTVWMTGGLMFVTNQAFAVTIGSNGVGRVTVSNGTWFASDVVVGLTNGAQGTLTIAGGTNEVLENCLIGDGAGSSGTVWMTGGQLILTNPISGRVTVGQFGNGLMTVSNGMLQTGEMVVGGPAGRLTIAGGTNNFRGVSAGCTGAGTTGRVFVTGGLLISTNAGICLAEEGVGDMTVSGGHIIAAGMHLGQDPGSQGTLTISGGQFDMTGPVRIGDIDLAATGTIVVTGGQLAVTNATGDAQVLVGNPGKGSFTINNGSVTVDNLIATNASGTISFNGGTLTTKATIVANGQTFTTGAGAVTATLNLIGGDHGFSDGLRVGSGSISTGRVWMTGASLTATNVTIGSSGSGELTISNGVAQLHRVTVASSGAGTLTVAGGTVSLTEQFDVGFGSTITGTVWVTGGQLALPNSSALLGAGAVGTMSVSNGTVLVGALNVGSSGGKRSTLTVAGGTNTVAFLAVGDSSCTTTGIVTVAGGSLFVTNAGATARLEVRTGTLTVNGGLLQVNRLVATNTCGRIVHAGGTITTDSTSVSNGLAFVVGGGTAPATLNLRGGSHVFQNGFDVRSSGSATSTVWMTGQELVVTNAGILTFIGTTGSGQMTVSNGVLRSSQLRVGSSGTGTLTIAGGTNETRVSCEIGGSPNATGTVWVTNGRLVDTSNLSQVGSSGFGRQVVSNGTADVQRMQLGTFAGSRGELTVAGGTQFVGVSLTLGNYDCSATGLVNVVSGNLSAVGSGSTRLEVRSGTLTQSGGSLEIGVLVITNACGRFIHTGGSLTIGTTVLGADLDADGDTLPNGWEQMFGLDALDPFGDNGPDGDADGDGLSNLDEFQAGTLPTAYITAITREGNNVRINWNAWGGNTNALEVTAGGAGGSFSNNFSDIVTNIIPGIGRAVTNAVDTNGATNVPSRYYRVRLVP